MSAPSGESDPAPRHRTLLGEAGPYITLGWQIALGFAFFVGIGALIDVWLDTLPWFLLGGVLLGIVAIAAQLYKVTVELGRQDARRARNRLRKPTQPGPSRRNVPRGQDDDDWDRRWEEKWSDQWDDDRRDEEPDAGPTMPRSD